LAIHVCILILARYKNENKTVIAFINNATCCGVSVLLTDRHQA